MGYKRPKKVYKLVFADEEFAGLEVRATSIPLGQLMEFEEAFELATKDAPTVAIGNERATNLFKLFVDVIVDWNLEDESDQPVPVSVDGLLSCERDFVIQLVAAWKIAVSGVSRPLEQPSPDGEQFQEQSIPMEIPSESPES